MRATPTIAYYFGDALKTRLGSIQGRSEKNRYIFLEDLNSVKRSWRFNFLPITAFLALSVSGITLRGIP